MTIKRDDIQQALEMDGRPRAFPPPHPGELLRREFLEPMGISQTRLAGDLGIPIGRINAIVTGKRAITAETAILLATIFGTEPQFWSALQSGYDIACALQQMAPQIRRVRRLELVEQGA